MPLASYFFLTDMDMAIKSFYNKLKSHTYHSTLTDPLFPTIDAKKPPRLSVLHDLIFTDSSALQEAPRPVAQADSVVGRLVGDLAVRLWPAA